MDGVVPPAAHPLIGRESQLAAAAGFLDGLRASRGSLLLLHGEAGIGKTRLAEEIAGRGRDLGARSAWATGWQGDGAPPLWPWVQIVRRLTGSEDTLVRFVAESPGASPAATFARSETVAAVVRDTAAQGPLVLVLDDLQWADAESIRVLSFVASAVRDAAVVIVGTYRTDELDREHVAELARVGVTLSVPPLSAKEAAALLASATGDRVGEAAVDAVVTRSAGNPLFVWEYGQLMVQSARFDVAPAAVPGAAAAVIERRLARVAGDTVGVLGSAAVAGRAFSAADAARIGRADPAAVFAALQAAARAGLVIETSEAGEYRFGHDVVRDVVLAGIDATHRAALHLRAADVFAQRAANDPSFHAVVADHLDQAGPAHLAEAAEHWERAAQRARQVLAYDEAARFLARAVRGAGADPKRQAALLAGQGDCLLLAGDLDRGRACFLRAAELARAAGAPRTLAHAVLGIGAGPVAWEVPLGSTEQAGLVLHALDSLPPDETRLRAMLLARLSVTAATPETMELARVRATEALALAEDTGDPSVIAQALAAVNDAYAGPAYTTMRRDNADTIVELATADGDRMLELLGYRFRIVADLELGDVPAVDRDIVAFERVAAALRQPLVGWYVPLFRGMRALLAGDVDLAERYRQEVADAADATGSQNAVMLELTLRLGIGVATGRRIDPGSLDAYPIADPAAWATLAAGMAIAVLTAGDETRAHELLALHAGNDFARLGEDGEHLTTLAVFSRIAVATGDADAARKVYDLLRPHAGLWAVDGIAACCWGPVELELGRLAGVLGRPDDARAHLAAARRALERAGAPLLLAEVARLEVSVGVDAGDEANSSPDASASGVFRREGQFWTLTYHGRTVRVNASKGLHDLARLLAEPGREFHVLDLVGPAYDGTERTSGRTLDRARAGDAPPLHTGGDLGELLDARARAEYRRRLAELEDEIADAEADADLARAGKARAERDFIAAELAAALGLGGRPRRTGDPVERARKAVTARIRLTIGRIGREHPDLGRHLANAVRTGTTCRYQPETPVRWTL